MSPPRWTAARLGLHLLLPVGDDGELAPMAGHYGEVAPLLELVLTSAAWATGARDELCVVGLPLGGAARVEPPPGAFVAWERPAEPAGVADTCAGVAVLPDGSDPAAALAPATYVVSIAAYDAATWDPWVGTGYADDHVGGAVTGPLGEIPVLGQGYAATPGSYDPERILAATEVPTAGGVTPGLYVLATGDRTIPLGPREAGGDTSRGTGDP